MAKKDEKITYPGPASNPPKTIEDETQDILQQAFHLHFGQGWEKSKNYAMYNYIMMEMHKGPIKRFHKLLEKINYDGKPKIIPVRISHCPRCGDDHSEVKFYIMKKPLEVSFSGNGRLEYWAKCPNNEEPILLSQDTIERNELISGW